MMDKAGEQFWTQFWQGKKLPPPIRVKGRGPRAWFYQEFHRLWQAHLPGATSRPKKLLEIGCAQSRWLPYFAREWGYTVAGLDYSELGCAQSRALLIREGVRGSIYHQDMFLPASHQLEDFDLVLSNGVVEHFEDTAAVLAQMAAYLKPGGQVLTIVPNFTGWLGRLQSLVSPDILAIHRLLNREDLAAAHTGAGLSLQFCGYLSFLHFSVVNPGGSNGDWRKTCFFKGLKVATVFTKYLSRLCPMPVDQRTAGLSSALPRNLWRKNLPYRNNPKFQRKKTSRLLPLTSYPLGPTKSCTPEGGGRRTSPWPQQAKDCKKGPPASE
jgi:SAM-dependent methyltransferase